MLNIRMKAEVKEKHIVNTPMYAYNCKEMACLFMQNLALGNSRLETYLWFSMYFCFRKV